MSKFCQLSQELLPLIDVKSSFPLYLEHFLTDFLQTLYQSCYKEEVVWDRRWVNCIN